MIVQDVLDWINGFAPFDSAADFDNVGLLLGDPKAAVQKLLFTMDVTPAVAARAAQWGATVIIAHHPLIFTPLRRIDYTSPQGQAILELTAHHIHVIAAHTNWDRAVGGVSDALGHALSLTQIASIDEYLRMGVLPQPLSLEALDQLIAKRLCTKVKRYGFSSKAIQKIAVAGGAYGEAATEARLHGADAFIVGEIKHHQILDGVERGLVIYEVGHYATEAPGVKALYERFLADAAAASWQVEARLDDIAPYEGALL
ncbi:MAG: Nif3-like dinuclear metal center hexameric protein [Eubacteriales bacterium]|nr:Nif3-like dinuclear metal center hexameric protein [Eubacteriales bacterium]